MRLYSGTTKSLIEDSTYNRIATKLKDAFFLEFRYQPAVAEVNSWNNSLRAVSQIFQTASLLDHGVLLELQLPLTPKQTILEFMRTNQRKRGRVVSPKVERGVPRRTGAQDQRTYAPFRPAVRTHQHAANREKNHDLR